MGTRLPDKAPEVPPEGSQDDSRALIGGLQQSVTRRSTGSQERWTSLKKLYDAHLLAHARSRIGASLLRVLDPDHELVARYPDAFRRA